MDYPAILRTFLTFNTRANVRCNTLELSIIGEFHKYQQAKSFASLYSGTLINNLIALELQRTRCNI